MADGYSGKSRKTTMTVLDANAVLRFLLGDITEQAAVTKQTIAQNDCLIPVEVIAEIVYVLGGWYKLPRKEITEKIRELIAVKVDMVEKDDVVSFAAALFETDAKLDFVDCLLIGYQTIYGYSVLTFDNDLKKRLSAQV